MKFSKVTAASAYKLLGLLSVVMDNLSDCISLVNLMKMYAFRMRAHSTNRGAQ
jgi:hypothetical protein